MKTNKIFSSLPVFFTGLIAGLTLAGLFAFTMGPGAAGTGGNVAVSVSKASQYSKNYLAGAQPYDQVIRGFMVGKAQLEAMNSLLVSNPSLVGFRIYMGADEENRRKDVVVGVDRNGADAVTSPIISTDAAGNNPCPPVCDSNSPILK